MKRFSAFLSIILFSFYSNCFALDVTVVDKSSNPTTVTNSSLDVFTNPASSVISGQNNNVASGTAVAVGSSTSISSLSIRADSGNDNFVYVGTSSVTTTSGFRLASGNTITIDTDNLADVYVISGGSATTDIDRISYIAEVQ